MDILNKPLNSLTFEDIVSFAKENHPEGPQLDYKEEVPEKNKLAQLITAFANTRGGVIIIGVKENRDNGLPAKYEGIADGHHDEFIAQVISNISPIPNYEFHKTVAKEGKVFLVIRIFEGDETPYYPHNDINIWIRTGSIKKSVDIASPEHVELLFKKKERGQKSREKNEKIAWENYEAYLQRAEKERQIELAKEKQIYEIEKAQWTSSIKAFKSKLPQAKIGSNVAMCSVIIQPFYPQNQLIKPLDIEPTIIESEASNNGFSFPRRAARWDSIREGMIQFIWERHSGAVHCQQVFANGLMFTSQDILEGSSEKPFSYLSNCISQLYITLRGARTIFEKLGYQGSLFGEMKITGILGATVIPAVQSIFRDEDDISRYNELSWPIELDTRIIANEVELRKFVTEFIKNIHWSFGYKDLQKSITSEKLEKDGYFRP